MLSFFGTIYSESVCNRVLNGFEEGVRPVSYEKKTIRSFEKILTSAYEKNNCVEERKFYPVPVVDSSENSLQSNYGKIFVQVDVSNVTVLRGNAALCATAFVAFICCRENSFDSVKCKFELRIRDFLKISDCIPRILLDRPTRQCYYIDTPPPTGGGSNENKRE